MRALAVMLAGAAAICIVVAIVGMVTGRPGDRGGLVFRVVALVLFAAGVALNVAAH